MSYKKLWLFVFYVESVKNRSEFVVMMNSLMLNLVITLFYETKFYFISKCKGTGAKVLFLLLIWSKAIIYPSQLMTATRP